MTTTRETEPPVSCDLRASGIAVAASPVSFGVFEVDYAHPPIRPQALLRAVAAAGYAGVESGPPGFFARGAELADQLHEHGLTLAASFVSLRLGEAAEVLEEDLPALARALDDLRHAGGRDARVIIADAGAGPAARLRRAGDAPTADERTWRRLVAGVARAAELARYTGVEPVVHHHGGTHVETPADVERLLEDCDVDILLDTGHLTIAGGDPVAALSAWGARVGHVHVKDVRAGALARVVGGRGRLLDVWSERVFCELGAGDVDLRAFAAELRRQGYAGWLTVEQDHEAGPEEDFESMDHAQRRNRRWLDDNLGL